MAIYVNIITPFTNETFIRQLSPEFASKGLFFYENSVENKIWDYVIVYEGISTHTKIHYKTGGLFFFSGESPMSRKYSTCFLNQFDIVISSHKNIKHKNSILYQQCLPWHFGFDYQNRDFKFSYSDLECMPFPKKIRPMSIITSSKRMMPGHNLRMKFVTELQKRFNDKIDYYGIGINPINDKAEGLLNYMFNICIENSSVNDYWTEKIADSFLGFAVPIYAGCVNIENYFGRESYIPIDISDVENSCHKIESLLMNAEKFYEERIPYILSARDKILNQYNLFNVIEGLINDNFNFDNRSASLIDLYPSDFFIDHKIKNSLLRINRLISRI